MSDNQSKSKLNISDINKGVSHQPEIEGEYKVKGFIMGEDDYNKVGQFSKDSERQAIDRLQKDNNDAYKILATIYHLVDEPEFHTAMSLIVNKVNPNFSVCPHCRVDDFQHVEDCGYMLKDICGDMRDYVI